MLLINLPVFCASIVGISYVHSRTATKLIVISKNATGEEDKNNRRRLAEHDFCRGGRSDLLIGLGNLILWITWITQGLQLSADESDSDDEDSDED